MIILGVKSFLLYFSACVRVNHARLGFLGEIFVVVRLPKKFQNDPVYGIARIAWLTNINKYYSASYTEILLLTVRSYSKFLPTIINNNMQAMNT